MPGDEDALVQWADNWNVARNLRDSFPHPYTLPDAWRWIAQCNSNPGPLLDFAIELSGQVVGGIGLQPQSDIFRCTIELGYWIAEPYWGRGIASEAVDAIVWYGFEMLPEITSIQARHIASNPASGRVLEKCGFRLEGRLRDAAVKAGIVSDVLVYSKTRKDVETAGRVKKGPRFTRP